MLLPEGGVGAARHAVRARAEGARLRDRHAVPVPRDIRALARRREPVRHEDRGVRGRRRGRWALGDESRPLPRDRQDRAAQSRAARPRRLDHRHPSRPVVAARGRSEARLGRKARAVEGEPARRLDRRGLLGLHPRARAALQPAPRPGLRVDRRHALDPAGQGPRGPLGRHGTNRMRAAYMSGFVLWFTGLSGAGKTTIANNVEPELERRGFVVDHLDGDIVRTHLSRGLGFSKEDRDTNIARIGWVASRLARAGAVVIVSAISPYEEMRRHARSLVEQHAPFVEVYVATSLEECARRDPKGLYAAAFAGEIEDFTGVSAPYEEPLEPELRLETMGRTPGESAATVIDRLEELNLLPERVESQL